VDTFTPEEILSFLTQEKPFFFALRCGTHRRNGKIRAEPRIIRTTGPSSKRSLGSKRQKQPIGITISMDGLLTAAFDAGQILGKELIEAS
jgi:hypothetical protein